jgi:hypothetical protein
MEHSKILTALFITTLLVAPLVMGADPDPLQDFCVADLNGTPLGERVPVPAALVGRR